MRDRTRYALAVRPVQVEPGMRVLTPAGDPGTVTTVYTASNHAAIELDAGHGVIAYVPDIRIETEGS